MNQLKETLHVTIKTYYPLKFYSRLYWVYVRAYLYRKPLTSGVCNNRLGRLYYAVRGHMFRLHVIQIAQ